MAMTHSTSYHFDRVASDYAQVRDTDPHVVETIIDNLPQHDRPIDVADVGCGTGRYTSILVKRCDRRLRLLCCDYSGAMLAECSNRMNREFPLKEIHYCRVCANDLPFSDARLDAVLTFNAAHHFDLDRFVTNASHVLRPGGLLSIYTRTPEQNARTIWGQYFPGFTQRETRLYCCKRLEEAILCVSSLELEGLREFEFVRLESRESLLNRARHFHYSTFALYPREHFNRAMAVFAQRLAKLPGHLIKHSAENTLVLARRK